VGLLNLFLRWRDESLGWLDVLLFFVHLGVNLFCYQAITKAMSLGVNYSSLQ
jgi:multidrug transporter EmrE-like cation transporter